MRLVGIATFSAFVETSIKRITCEFSGACCLPGPTTNGGGDRSSRSSLSSYHPDVPGAIVGVFVPRYETDSTFASTSLQRNETVIAFASDERPFLGHFDPAKVLPVSVGRAVWPAKVLPVSIGACSVVCKGVGGFKAPVIASCARKSSPCSAWCGCEREKVRPASPVPAVAREKVRPA